MTDPVRAIVIEVKNVCGELKVYPACPQSKIFAEIAGTRTLTHRTLCQIEALGYSIIEGKPRHTWKDAA